MRLEEAIRALSALAQDTRLAVFRMMIREGPHGLPAGTIAARLRVPSATLSFHLAQLERAHLLTSRRRRRQIFYAADFAGTRRLMTFLTEDCCGGRPEICAGIFAAQRNEESPHATDSTGE